MLGVFASGGNSSRVGFGGSDARDMFSSLARQEVIFGWRGGGWLVEPLVFLVGENR